MSDFPTNIQDSGGTCSDSTKIENMRTTHESELQTSIMVQQDIVNQRSTQLAHEYISVLDRFDHHVMQVIYEADKMTAVVQLLCDDQKEQAGTQYGMLKQAEKVHAGHLLPLVDAMSTELVDMLKVVFEKSKQQFDGISQDCEASETKHVTELCDIRGQLELAHDNHKAALQDVQNRQLAELQSVQDLHTAKLDDFRQLLEQEKNQHAVEMQRVEDGHSTVVNNINQTHAAELQGLGEQHAVELKGFQDMHTTELYDIRQELRQAQEQHAAELQSANHEHAAELQSFKDRYLADLHFVNEQHADELEEVQDAHTADLRSVHQQHEAEMRSVRDQHADELKGVQDMHISDMNYAHQQHEAELQLLRENHDMELHRWRLDLGAAMVDDSTSHAILQEQRGLAREYLLAVAQVVVEAPTERQEELFLTRIDALCCTASTVGDARSERGDSTMAGTDVNWKEGAWAVWHRYLSGRLAVPPKQSRIESLFSSGLCVCATRTQSLLCVSDQINGAVRVYDAESKRLLLLICDEPVEGGGKSLGMFPAELAVLRTAGQYDSAPDDYLLLVSDFNNSCIKVFDAFSGSLRRQLKCGRDSGPYGITTYLPTSSINSMRAHRAASDEYLLRRHPLIPATEVEVKHLGRLWVPATVVKYNLEDDSWTVDIKNDSVHIMPTAIKSRRGMIRLPARLVDEEDDFGDITAALPASPSIHNPHNRSLSPQPGFVRRLPPTCSTAKAIQSKPSPAQRAIKGLDSWCFSPSKQSSFSPQPSGMTSSGQLFTTEKDWARAGRTASASTGPKWHVGRETPSSDKSHRVAEDNAFTSAAHKQESTVPPPVKYDSACVFITENHAHRVKLLDVTTGLVMREIGFGSGRAEGELQSPSSLALIPATAEGQTNLLFVADTGNNRVQVFDADSGAFVRILSTVVDGVSMNRPHGLALAACDDGSYVLFIADTGNHRVIQFKIADAFGKVGDLPDPDVAEGQSIWPLLHDGRQATDGGEMQATTAFVTHIPIPAFKGGGGGLSDAGYASGPKRIPYKPYALAWRTTEWGSGLLYASDHADLCVHCIEVAGKFRSISHSLEIPQFEVHQKAGEDATAHTEGVTKCLFPEGSTGESSTGESSTGESCTDTGTMAGDK